MDASPTARLKAKVYDTPVREVISTLPAAEPGPVFPCGYVTKKKLILFGTFFEVQEHIC
jgi:hypothetical protein